MSRRSYASDLTDAQWSLVEPMLPRGKVGRQPRYGVRTPPLGFSASSCGRLGVGGCVSARGDANEGPDSRAVAAQCFQTHASRTNFSGLLGSHGVPPYR